MAFGVEEASHEAAIFVKVSECPATESCNGSHTPALTVKFSGVFPENPLDDRAVVDMLISHRTNGRATGETAFFLIRDTQSRFKVVRG
jgi:hypothetical protein